jgi:hypothetical protein
LGCNINAAQKQLGAKVIATPPGSEDRGFVSRQGILKVLSVKKHGSAVVCDFPAISDIVCRLYLKKINKKVF